MAESDSDVDFQSADEGDGDATEKKLQVNTDCTEISQSENNKDVEEEKEIRTIDKECNAETDGEFVKAKGEEMDDVENVEIPSKRPCVESEKGECSSDEQVALVGLQDNSINDMEACVDNIETVDEDASKERLAEINKDNNVSVPSEQMIGRGMENESELKSQTNINLAKGDCEKVNLQNPLDKLAEAGSKTQSSGGWGGWGKSLISSTVSGLGHGLSSALHNMESSLGVPQPEELAKQPEKSNETLSLDKEQKEAESEAGSSVEDSTKEDEIVTEKGEEKVITDENNEKSPASGYTLFSYGASALTGMVVKTVSGGLGALEMIGKKTMDVIQDGDPGLRKKRQYFSKSNLPSLSQTLKEAAEIAEKAALKEQEVEEINRAHFGILFDKYQGLSHLEALEMLSNQGEGKVHAVMTTVTGDQLENLKAQMIEIRDAFQLQDMDIQEENYDTACFVDTITEHLFTLSIAATPDKLKRVQRETHEWLAKCKQELEALREHKEHTEEATDEMTRNDDDDDDDDDDKPKDEETQDRDGDNNKEVKSNKALNEFTVPKEIYVKAIQTLAELTARCIEQFHKAAELMLLKHDEEHTKNPIQRAASLSKLTSVLCSEVNGLTSQFCDRLNTAAAVADETQDVNSFITNIFLEGSNSMSYIQDAFQLILPVLQVVAIEISQMSDTE